MRVFFTEDDETLHERNYTDAEVTALLRSDKVHLPISDEKHYRIKKVVFVESSDQDAYLYLEGRLYENKPTLQFG